LRRVWVGLRVRGIAGEIVGEERLVWMVPPRALSVIARVFDRLKLAPSCSVPPPKVSGPVLAPRLLSALTLTVPPLRLAPEYPFAPVSVSVPVPVLVNAPAPAIAWAIVVEKPFVSMVPPTAF